ncbi:MAG: hypothetical protein JWN04_933 [Myxococcaceae bacterium]|nr:hypothetical protein [Myxococcaceae bacterium]
MRASLFVTIGIGGLAVLVASAFVFAYASAVGRTGGNRTYARMGARTALLAWMTMFAVLAESGKLADFDRRPPPLLMAIAMFVASGLVLGYSRIGTTFVRGLPLVWIIAAQGFRLPLEIVMHQAAREGVMPMEMSYAGYNFDILTGVSALVLAFYVKKGRASERLIYAWNTAGSILLGVVVSIALLASPMIRAFGDAPQHVNTWIAYFPFVWLGAVLVAAAVFGHVITFRILSASRASASSPPPSWAPPSSL